MPNDLQALANKARDDAFQQCVGKATSVLLDNLVAAGDDAAQVDDCKAKYKNAMGLCRQVHEIASEVIRVVFP